MYKSIFSVTSAVTLLFPPFHAAQANELEPLVVTATRTARTVDETLAAVSVITRADIERRQPLSIQELLQSVPGVDIDNSGGAGKVTSLMIRGSEADHVLVLVDGINMGSVTTGAAAFQHIPVEQIERIEIVRGPRSSLYGSEAIGGVVQIFTRRGGQQNKPFFSISGGAHDSASAAAGFSGGNARGHFSVSLSGQDTGGFNACNGKPFPNGAGCYTFEPDRDGYRALAGALRAGYRFANGVEIDAHALRVRSDTEYDGSFGNQAIAMQQILGANLRFAVAEDWQMALMAGQNQDKSDDFANGVFGSRFNSARDSVSWQNDIAWGADHLFTVGADWRRDRVDSTAEYAITSRANHGGFGQYQGEINGHEVQFSARHDDNESFGGHTTGHVAWGTALGEHVRVSAAYGTAFKAPSFNELYYPNYGNPHLQPEQANSLEIRLSGRLGQDPEHKRCTWAVSGHETRVEDLIAHDAAINAPNNIHQARIRGMEAELALPIGAWQLHANFTWQDPRNQSADANHGKLLPRRARINGELRVDRAWGQYSLGASVRTAGRRFDDLANTTVLGGYALVDMQMEYRLSPAWRVQARLENVLDKSYETAAFYNQPGRGLYVTLRYQP